MSVQRCGPYWKPPVTAKAAPSFSKQPSKASAPSIPPMILPKPSVKPRAGAVPVYPTVAFPVPHNKVSHVHSRGLSKSHTVEPVSPMDTEGNMKRRCHHPDNTTENLFEHSLAQPSKLSYTSREVESPCYAAAGSSFDAQGLRSSPPILFKDSISLKPKPQAAVQPTPVVVPKESKTETMSMPYAKYHILAQDIKVMQTTKWGDVQMSVKEVGDEANIELTGTDEAINSAKISLYEAMNDVAEFNLKLNREIATILSGNAGKKAVKNKLDENGLKAQLYKHGHTLVIVGTNQDGSKAASLVQDMVGKFDVTVKDHHKTFMNSDVWKEATKSLEEGGLVVIKTKKDVVELHGFKEETKTVRKTIEGMLQKNSFKKERVELMKGVYRCIKQHCGEEIQDITQK